MSQQVTTIIGTMKAQLSMLDDLVQSSASVKHALRVMEENQPSRETPDEIVTLVNQTEYAVLSVRNAVTAPATVTMANPLPPEEAAKAVHEAERQANDGRSASLLDTGQNQQDRDINEYLNLISDDIVKLTKLAAEFHQANPDNLVNDFACAMTLVASANLLKCVAAMRPKPADRLHIPIART